MGSGLNPQYTVPTSLGRLWVAHEQHRSVTTNDNKRRTLHKHGSGASFRTTEQRKVTQVSKERDVSNSQSADRVFCTACPTDGEVDWSIVHKDGHEEVAMKVMINEASTLLSVVTNGKAPTEGTGLQGTGPLHCFQGSSWTARGRKEDRHGVTLDCTPKDSFVNKRHHTFVVAPGLRGFIQNMTTGALHADTGHILVPDRQPSHLDACTQNSSPSSCRVHTKRGIC